MKHPARNRHLFARMAITEYDAQGGLANDTHARHAAVAALAQDLGIDSMHAYELLADALARRAAERSTQEGLQT